MTNKGPKPIFIKGKFCDLVSFINYFSLCAPQLSSVGINYTNMECALLVRTEEGFIGPNKRNTVSILFKRKSATHSKG